MFGLTSIINVGNTRSQPSLNEVIKIEDISFEVLAEITLISAKNYKVEGNIGITRKVQVPDWFFLYTGAGSSLISESMKALSWRNRIQGLKVPRFATRE